MFHLFRHKTTPHPIFKLRHARLKDLPAISELAVEMLKYHQKFDVYFRPDPKAARAYSNFFKKCILSHKHLLLVAEFEHKIIGYTLAYLSDRPPVFELKKIGVISDMYIEKEFRHQGVAKLFLNEIYHWFKLKKISHIQLNYHNKNQIGTAAWNKYGFKGFMTITRHKI